MTIDKIDKINIEIMIMLIQAKSSLDIFTIVSNNAKKINEIPIRGDFWGFIQKIALDSLILSICKVFDKDRVCGYTQNSIEAILDIIETDQIRPIHEETILEFLNKYSKEISYSNMQNDAGLDFCILCRKFKNKYEQALEKIRHARNKKVSHSDTEAVVTSIAPLVDIEKVLEFGYDFYATVSNAYVGIGPIDIRKNNRKKASLEKIFGQLGLISK